MFLCRGIHSRNQFYPMAGIFPFEIVLGPKPQGHGYTIMECVNPNPFFKRGATIRGHEFHYSRIVEKIDPESYPFAFKLKKGHGIVAGWDGACYKNVLAGYSHLHAAGNEDWADAMIAAAGSYRRNRNVMSADSRMDPERVPRESQGYPTVY